MKKIFYYLLLIVLAGGAVVSFWAYQRYFKVEAPKFLTFTVVKGDIQDVVKVRGEVAPQKDFDLEFPFSGIVERIFVKDGQLVNQNDPLMKLETIDFELEIQKNQTQLVQAEANFESTRLALGKIELQQNQQLRGDVLNENYQNGMDILSKLYGEFSTTLENLKNIYFLIDLSERTNSGCYIKYYDLEGCNITYYVNRNKEFASVPTQILNLYLSISDLYEPSFADYQLAKRSGDNNVRSSAIKEGHDLVTQTAEMIKISRDVIQSFQDALIKNGGTFNKQAIVDEQSKDLTDYSTTMAGYEKDLLDVIYSINNYFDSIAGQPIDIKSQEVLIKQAEANIQNYQAQIAIIQEKIKKSTLYAPASAKVAKVWLEKQELAKPGQTAITLETSGHKIQADISELEIGKIREGDGNEVLIRFDAFPLRTLKGKVVSVDAKEIIKEGDKYYRANIYLDPHGAEIRSGMNTDLVILVSSRNNVLKIPDLAIYKKDEDKFVTVLEEGKQKEVKVETGIFDGESVEVIKGLTEGQTIMVLAD